MEKIREEFEAQMRAMGMFEQGGEPMARCPETDGYTDQDTNAMWVGFQVGWKASRATLCVKLPKFEDGSLRGYSGDCEEATIVVDCIAESLERAGISYE